MNQLYPIPGFPKYAADKQGNIWSLKYGDPRRISSRKREGYEVVGLRVDGRSIYRDVHRLMALTFLGEPSSPKHIVLHWDDNRINNKLTNLRWGTRHENAADSRRLGTNRKPTLRKLTPDQVRELRTRKMGVKKYAAKFGVTPFAIQLAQRRQTYAEII